MAQFKHLMKVPVEISEPGAIAATDKKVDTILDKEVAAQAAADPELPV